MRFAVRMIRQAISPRLATRSLWKRRADDTSHPENAEAGRLRRRRIHAGGERQSQHGAGVGRIDDAVVPDARARVVGMTLLLVLLADRRLEGLVVGDRPGAALGLGRFLAQQPQYARGLLAAHHRDARVRP